MSSDKEYSNQQRLDNLYGRLSGATNSPANFDSNRATTTSLTPVASALIEAAKVDVAAVYRLTCYGHGTWPSTGQTLQFQNQLAGGGGTISMGSAMLGANFMAVSTPFRWRVVCEWFCQSLGTSGEWFGAVSGQISVFGTTLLTGGSASPNATAGFCGSNFVPQQQDTTTDMTGILAAAWGGTTGGPTLTKDYRIFQRVG